MHVFLGGQINHWLNLKPKLPVYCSLVPRGPLRLGVEVYSSADKQLLQLHCYSKNCAGQCVEIAADSTGKKMNFQYVKNSFEICMKFHVSVTSTRNFHVSEISTFKLDFIQPVCTV